jgi:CspA family cold shock protein
LKKEKTMSRERGTVKWFDEAKNFGFITPDGGNKDIFFHRTDIETMGGAVEKGERVEYEVAPGTKGPQAKKVTSIPSE